MNVLKGNLKKLLSKRLFHNIKNKLAQQIIYLLKITNIVVRSIYEFIKSNLTLANILNILMLIVTIVTLDVAISTLKTSDQQNKDNKKNSEDLFRRQLKHSQKLTDDMVKQLDSLQQITNSQLDLTKKQLLALEKIIYDQKYLGHPNIVSTTEFNMMKHINNKSEPSILIYFSNKGERTAEDININYYLVRCNLLDVLHQKQIINKIEKGISLKRRYEETIESNSENCFYFCYKYDYLDTELTKRFYDEKFYVYKNQKLFECDDILALLLKNRIDQYLKLNK